MTKKDAYNIALKQLALEYNCLPSDFSRDEILILSATDVVGRRMFEKDVPYFRMITFGTNVVFSTDLAIHPFLNEYVKDKKWNWLFEEHNLLSVNDELKKYGYELSHSVHSFLPETDILNINNIIPVKWFRGENELLEFFPNISYPNALSQSEKPNLNRPDVIAVASYDVNDNSKITGMAGASMDTPILWQIGIDIEPQYRNIGLGTYLVTLLKNEILRLGKVPYYSTTSANIPSKRISYNSRFYPAWVEIFSKHI